MRRNYATQSLSYPIRLPDVVQADALRLLDVSREVINATVSALWDRQWRCEAEQAGRILRAQAERKKQFALILPVLSQGMILPRMEKKAAGKNRKAIKQALDDLRDEHFDGAAPSNCKA